MCSFGLIYLDCRSQRRIPKASPRWYARTVAASRQALPRDEAAAPWPVLSLSAPSPNAPREIDTEMTYLMTEAAGFLSVLHHEADERLRTLR